jgi:hypothetical protein
MHDFWLVMSVVRKEHSWTSCFVGQQNLIFELAQFKVADAHDLQ